MTHIVRPGEVTGMSLSGCLHHAWSILRIHNHRKAGPLVVKSISRASGYFAGTGCLPAHRMARSGRAGSLGW